MIIAGFLAIRQLKIIRVWSGFGSVFSKESLVECVGRGLLLGCARHSVDERNSPHRTTPSSMTHERRRQVRRGLEGEISFIMGSTLNSALESARKHFWTHSYNRDPEADSHHPFAHDHGGDPLCTASCLTGPWV